MANNINPKKFGEQIKKIRLNHNYSLRQVSLYSKSENQKPISPSYWSLIERGERNIPKPETLRRIAKGLRVEPNEILKLAGYEELENNNSNEKEYVDMKEAFNGKVVMTYEGKPIPKKDIELMKRLLRIDEDD